jgi:hypothetical protein
MSLSWFPIAVLGVWRVAHLLAAEDGPWDLVVRLRHAAGSGFWGRLMDCFSCLSLWVALPFAALIGDRWLAHLVAWPALSAGAMLIERLTLPRAAPPAIYEEQATTRKEE